MSLLQGHGGGVDTLVLLFVHFVSVALFIFGFIYNQKNLFHGGECEMTYSRYQFVKLMKDEGRRRYSLYKFTDARDPRYTHLTAEQLKGHFGTTTSINATTTTKWCNSNEMPVLYIPGHWGSYLQARSLGAHGLQMTRSQQDVRYERQVRDALWNNKWREWNATSPQEFVYSVYAVDFEQEGTGLHASLIRNQADFVTRAILEIVRTCNAQQFVVVAHSMGGWVAQTAINHSPDVRQHVQHLITLATPWTFPYTVEKSMATLLSTPLDPLVNVISISGGMRDEQIPPLSGQHNHGVSILANTVTKRKVSIGMDHRAIVWCHQLLEVVRNLLYEISIDVKRAPFEIVQNALHDDSTVLPDYAVQVQQLQTEFRFQHPWASHVMEVSQLYRMELLLGLVVVLSILHQLFGKHSVAFLASCAIASFLKNGDLRPTSLAIIVGVANTLLTCTLKAMEWLPKSKGQSQSPFRFAIRWIVLLLTSRYLMEHVPPWWSPLCLLLTVLELFALALFNSPNAPWCATLFLVVPALCAGHVVVAVKHFMHGGAGLSNIQGNDLMRFVINILSPLLWSVNLDKDWAEAAATSLFRKVGLIAVLAWSLLYGNLLQMGHGYVCGYALAMIAVMDCLLTLVAWVVSRRRQEEVKEE